MVLHFGKKEMYHWLGPADKEKYNHRIIISILKCAYYYQYMGVKDIKLNNCYSSFKKKCNGVKSEMVNKN